MNTKTIPQSTSANSLVTIEFLESKRDTRGAI